MFSHPFLFFFVTVGYKAVEDIAVVTFHDRELRHGFTWYRLALASVPIPHMRLGDFLRCVVHKGCCHNLAEGFREMSPGKFACLSGYLLEYVPIVLRFPAGRYGSGEGMDEGVKVGGVKVILFIPCCSGQNNI